MPGGWRLRVCWGWVGGGAGGGRAGALDGGGAALVWCGGSPIQPGAT